MMTVGDEGRAHGLESTQNLQTSEHRVHRHLTQLAID